MTYYEFGIMSKRWSLEATTSEVAKIAMTLFIRQNIPVAIYLPKQESFLPINILNDLEMNTRTKNNVKKAMESIKQLD